MSHVRIASIALVGLALSTVGAAEPAAPPTGASGIRHLIESNNATIKELVDRNNALETENQNLRLQIKGLQTRLAANNTGSQGMVPETLPPGWKKGMYEGLPLYLIPCETGSNPVKNAPAVPAR